MGEALHYRKIKCNGKPGTTATRDRHCRSGRFESCNVPVSVPQSGYGWQSPAKPAKKIRFSATCLSISMSFIFSIFAHARAQKHASPRAGILFNNRHSRFFSVSNRNSQSLFAKMITYIRNANVVGLTCSNGEELMELIKLLVKRAICGCIR